MTGNGNIFSEYQISDIQRIPDGLAFFVVPAADLVNQRIIGVDVSSEIRGCYH